MRLQTQIVFYTILFFISLPLQAGDPVLSIVESGDTEQLESYLEEHDINAPLKDSGHTLLVHAIHHADAGMVEYLLEKGADVELFVEGQSPLMHAVREGDIRKVRRIVNAGADLEVQDSLGNTALMYAAVSGHTRITKYLIRKDAYLFHKNKEYLTPNDAAVRSGHTDLAIFIRSAMEKNLPDMHDGPYVNWTTKRRLKAMYITHDGESQQTRKNTRRFRARHNPFLLEGFSEDTLDYLIHRRRSVPPDHFEKASRILVVGDVHGGYDSLILLLQHNRVINADLEWIFGTASLVFLGDIFDRGDKVTETLWLIYQLEHQAGLAGGSVHLILGNHEILVLTGNEDYISDKYRITTEKLNLSYAWLYRRRTVLGQWLRTRNSIISINDYLFVHAGLSPRLARAGFSIREINDMVRYFIRHPAREDFQGTDRQKIFGSSGPFWFRGYHENNHESHRISEAEFEQVLEAFPARKIFVGHTNVPEITSIFGGKVFSMDVPFYTPGYSMQAILIDDGQLLLVRTHGEPSIIPSHQHPETSCTGLHSAE